MEPQFKSQTLHVDNQPNVNQIFKFPKLLKMIAIILMQLLWFGERNKYADGDSLCAASGHQIQFHLAQRGGGGSSATFLGVRPSVNGRDSTPGPSRHPASNQLSHCCPALVTARFSSTALHKSFPKFSKIFSNFFPKFFQNFPIFFQIFPNFFPNFFPISF